MSRSNIDPQRRALLARLLALGGAATGLSLLPTSVWAASAASRVSNLRVSSDKQTTRVVFDLSQATDHNLFMLHQPERLVIDFNHTQVGDALTLAANPLVRDVRYAVRNGNDLRVVLDLNAAAQPSSFLLPPGNGVNHYRLVLDLQQQAPTVAAAPVKSVTTDKQELRDLVVVIDPGHGGKDPGAIGPKGTYEKNVVLPIAKELHDRLNKQRGIKAHLTRDTDVYLHLRERTQIAHAHKADLFISVHADACENPKVDGSSVYVLSEHGASSELARQLARSQNGADSQVGNIDLSGKSKMLASVLLDLSQTAALSSSDRLARQLLNNFHNKLNNRVERAAFVVLKSPDIPSVLVETAFISNPKQEKLLRTKGYQRKIADSMHDGVMSYFRQYAPTDTLLASITRGDVAG